MRLRLPVSGFMGDRAPKGDGRWRGSRSFRPWPLKPLAPWSPHERPSNKRPGAHGVQGLGQTADERGDPFPGGTLSMALRLSSPGSTKEDPSRRAERLAARAQASLLARDYKG